MPISTEHAVVARCDSPKCKAVRFGSDQEPPVGLAGSLHLTKDIGADGLQIVPVSFYACRTAHVKDAIEEQVRKAVLAGDVVYPALDKTPAPGTDEQDKVAVA